MNQRDRGVPAPLGAHRRGEDAVSPHLLKNLLSSLAKFLGLHPAGGASPEGIAAADIDADVASIVDEILDEARGAPPPYQPESSFTEFLENRIKVSGKPWSWEGHEYLRALAEERARHQVVRKAAQVGVTTLKAAEMLYYGACGRALAYYMPTRDTAQDVVQGIVNPMINDDAALLRLVAKADEERQRAVGVEEELRRRGKAPDTIRLIQIGANGKLYFRGLQRVHHAKSIALDGVFLDEVAELTRQRDPELGVTLISFVQDRLMHSDLKLIREFSQPSVPMFDVDEAFQQSDQKFYLHRCGKCRTWFSLEEEFPRTLAAFFVSRAPASGQPLGELNANELEAALADAEFRYVCPRCGRRLSKDGKREWVAKKPGREISGFSVSQLYAQLSPREVAARYLKALRSFSEMVTLTISVLGLPHAGDRQPLSEALLGAVCEDRNLEWDGKGAHYAGIDCGDAYHVVVARLDGDKLRVVWLEQTGEPERVAQILEHFDARFVVDAMPYKPVSKMLCRRIGKGQQGAILYSNTQTTQFGVEDQTTEPVKVVKVNRTEMIDRLCDAVLAQFLLLPSPRLAQTRQAIEHCKKLIRVRSDDGSWSYVRGAENHFGMSLAMMLVGVREQIPLRLGRIDYGKPRDWLVTGSRHEAITL